MGNPPDPVDPSVTAAQGLETAKAQQGMNLESWLSSLINQEGPTGSLTYNQTGTTPEGNPIMTAITKYAPGIQALFDKMVALKDVAGTGAKGLLDNAAYGVGTVSDKIGGLANGITGGIMDQWKSFHTPFMQQAKDRLHTQLSNRGLTPNDPAYRAAMQELDTSQGLTINNLIGSTGAKAYELASGMYKMPAELANMLAGLSAPGSATQDFTTNLPQVQPANLIGATANAQQAANELWKQQTQKYGDLVGGVGNIAGKLLGGWASSPAGGSALTSMFAFSDARLKTDIVPTGAKINGIDVYAFRFPWEGEPRLGMMAHEVEEVMPDAVKTVDGYKQVDYSKVLAPQER